MAARGGFGGRSISCLDLNVFFFFVAVCLKNIM